MFVAASETSSLLSSTLTSSWAVITFFCIAAVVGSSIAWLFLTYWKCEGLRGPTPLPVLGNSLTLERNAYDLYKQMFEWMKEFDYVLRLTVGFRNLAIFGTVEAAEAILSNSRNITKSSEYDFLFPWLKTGLLTSTGSKWRNRRRLLTPSFHFSILKDFFNVMVAQSDVLVNKLKLTTKSGQAISINPLVSCCSLDIMCEAAMGASCNAQKDSESQYVIAVHTMSRLIQDRSLRPWLWNDFLYGLTPAGRKHSNGLRLVHGFTSKIINDRIAELKNERKPSRSRYLNFLDVLLEGYQKGNIDVDGLNEEVDTFMFEGHDTTASAITFCLFALATHKDLQGKLYEEIRLHVTDDPASLESYITESKLLDCIIKESLRLYPSVPLMLRQLDEDVTIGPYHMKRGCSVGVSPLALHRNPSVWENEKEFNPDRFLPENTAKRSPYAFVPFSAGPRNCIGQRFAMMELKVVVTKIVREFELESTQEEEDLELCGELILRSRELVMIKLRQRHGN